MKAMAPSTLSCILSLLVPGQILADEFKPIFDGKTIEGWKAPNMSYWSVAD
jgi:hypothetical protein